jgi:hypothetical protein
VVNPGLTLPGFNLPGLLVKPPQVGTPPAVGAPPAIGTPPAEATPPAEGTLPLTVNPQFVLPPGTLKLQPGTATPAPAPGTETVEPEVVPQLQLQAPILMAPATPAQ